MRAAGWSCLLLGGMLRRPGDAVTIWEVGKPMGHIESREDLPGAEEFFRSYVLAEGTPFEGVGKPVLLKGAARRMPAMKWSDEYLRKHHAKTPLDQVETEKKETRTRLPHESWTMAKFLDNYKEMDVYSVASTPKGLDKEVYLLPVMNCNGYQKKLVSNVFWMSNGKTKSVIHKDGHNNLHCMFDGEKQWALWRPDAKPGIATAKMGWIDGEKEAKKNPEKFKDAYGQYAGYIDPEDVDVGRFPGWKKLEWWNMTLRRGDCAFIPPAWYHYVEAPAMRAVSVHLWFGAGKSWDGRVCEKLKQRGRNASEFVFRLGDCKFSEDGGPTKCRLPDKRLPQDLDSDSSSASVEL